MSAADLTEEQRAELHGHVTYLRRCGRRVLASIVLDLLGGQPVSARERERVLINAAFLDRQGYRTRGDALRALEAS